MTRLLTAKAVRKHRWLYTPKDILHIGGYDAACGGSLRIWTAARDRGPRHGPPGGRVHACGPQFADDARGVTRRIGALDRAAWTRIADATAFPADVAALITEKLVSRRNET